MTSLRPWSAIPIAECGEGLEDLPPVLLRLEPHPYQALGAPYGRTGSPFRLREGVVRRLREAQDALTTLELSSHPELGTRLAIFDAFRPVAVQSFMVEHACREEGRARGLDPGGTGAAWDAVRSEVGRFWAPPSEDPATPPPHSTGGAVDLTLADAAGNPLPMGGEIDAIGALSEPLHYAEAAFADPHGAEALWHRRRQRLAAVMEAAGFLQHPNEWWHFSHGDQLWAWRSGAPAAIYGRTGAEEEGCT